MRAHLYICIQEYPDKKSYAKSQSCYSKANYRHLKKPTPERNVFGNRDIKSENENHCYRIQNCEA